MTLLYRGPSALFCMPDNRFLRLAPGDEVDGPDADVLADHPQFEAKKAAVKKAAAPKSSAASSPTTQTPTEG